MSLIQRFSEIVQGAMVLTGNTLNITGGTPYPPAKSDFYNGAYISTDTSLVAAPGFPNGTTFSASQSSSSAVLNMPKDSTVLFAQLFWVIDNNAPSPDSSIKLTLPNKNIIEISPDLNLKQNEVHIWQAQDVTNIVNEGGTGTYTVGNVPGSIIENESSISPNSWYLLVVYRNTDLPYRYFSVNTGIEFIYNGTSSDVDFVGFNTPCQGDVKGYLLLSETEGDLKDTSKILVGYDFEDAVNVGNASQDKWDGLPPYAHVDNMLSGNILIADTNDPNIGMLDTRGSFGGYNKNPFKKIAPAFARNNMGILGLDISKYITNNQSSLFTRIDYNRSGFGQITSQSIQVDINSANLGKITKSVDKEYVSVGEILTYTVRMENTGTTIAKNVVLIDELSSNTSFIEGSAYIDGVNIKGADPSLAGIPIGEIESNQSTTITFKVLVNSVNESYSIATPSKVTYEFLPDRDFGIQYATVCSNIVDTSIIEATIRKEVNKSKARCKNIINYTNVYAFLNVPTTISNIIFKSSVPENTTLVPNSVKVEGIDIVDENLNIEEIKLATSITKPIVFTVNFKVTVNTVTKASIIHNKSKGLYSIDDGENIKNIEIDTNTVSTTLDPFNATISNLVDKSIAGINEKITYTVVIKNYGSTLSNVFFRDLIQNGTSIVPNSFRDGKTKIKNVDTSEGLALKNIAANSTRTITFQIVANTIPMQNPVTSFASVKLNYKLDEKSEATEIVNSSVVFTQINHGNIVASKTVDKTYVNVGEELSYAIILKNTGNVICVNMRLRDAIPEETSIVSDSFSINGITQSDVVDNIDVRIPDMMPNSVTTILFKSKVNSIPKVNPISNAGKVEYNYFVFGAVPVEAWCETNVVSTKVNNASLGQMQKSVDKAYAINGDILTYTTTIPNSGNVTATNVVFKAIVPNGTVLLPESVTVNGDPHKGENPEEGIEIGTINPGDCAVVKFSVKVGG